MSITEQRLKDYQLQMSIYAEQHNMILASDVLDMIEQLQDDLKDDMNNVVAQLNDKFRVVRTDEDLEWNRAMDEAITIVKGGGVDGN